MRLTAFFPGQPR